MSGSNVREIFTMKQALEKGSKDIVLELYFVIKNYNNWDYSRLPKIVFLKFKQCANY